MVLLLLPSEHALNQLRYDLPKMKGRGLLERLGRATPPAALRREPVRPPSSFSCTCASAVPWRSFNHPPTPTPKPPVKIEIAYQKADAAVQNLIDQLAAREKSQRKIPEKNLREKSSGLPAWSPELAEAASNNEHANISSKLHNVSGWRHCGTACDASADASERIG
jgi:hypothetical protein